MQQQNYPILTKTYELLKTTIALLQHFPRDQKFLLGDRIQNCLSDLLELYIEAVFSPSHQKTSRLHQANIQLEKLRYYFRLAYELGLYTSRKYESLNIQIQEIGKMTGGWIKSIKS